MDCHVSEWVQVDNTTSVGWESFPVFQFRHLLDTKSYLSTSVIPQEEILSMLLEVQSVKGGIK